jgi:Protein of unknown function (DUF2510)
MDSHLDAGGSTATADRSDATPAEQSDTALPPAGWYKDPEGPAQRWWDGARWTTYRKSERPDHGGMPPEVSRGMSAFFRQPKGFYWAALAVLAIAIGSLGPWARALFVTVNGTDGDGTWFLVGCLFVLISLWRYAKSGSAATLIFPVIGGLFIAGDSIYILDRLNAAGHANLFGQAVTIAQPQWGLYACLLGAGVLVVASLILAFTRRSRPVDGTPGLT